MKQILVGNCFAQLTSSLVSANQQKRQKENPIVGTLPELCYTATHNLALADQLRVKFRSVKGKENIEIDSVEGSLRSIHPLEVLF